MPVLWSDPNQDPATIAALQSRDNVPFQSVAPLVGDIIRQRMFQQQQQQQAVNQIGQGIGDYIKQRDADKIATAVAPTLNLNPAETAVVANADHPAQGVAAVIAARNQDLERQHIQAQIGETNARADYEKQHGNYWDNYGNFHGPMAAPGTGPTVSQDGMSYWNGHAWVRFPPPTAAAQASGIARGDYDPVAGTFTPNDAGKFMMTMNAQGKTSITPVETYNATHHQTPQNAPAQPSATPGQPAPQTQSQAAPGSGAGPSYKVGDQVRLKNGTIVTVRGVNPDGSIQY